MRLCAPSTHKRKQQDDYKKGETIGLALQSIEELQYNAVELLGLLHIRVMSRSRNNQLFRACNALLQRVGDLKDLWGILVTYHDEGWAF